MIGTDPSAAAIRTYLERVGLAPDTAVVALTGDASDRKYYRLRVPGTTSTVLQLNAAPFDPATLPFLNVTELLRRMSLPTPSILDVHEDLGLIVLEDLGDVTLQAHLGSASPEEHAALYGEAVELVASLQHRGAELASAEFVPYGIAFDVSKLWWEMEFFIKHFLVAYRGIAARGPHHDALRAVLREVVEQLAAEPRVLCHRDFHSRNLMLHGQRLYLIDYQDARMGPDTYDLASLLRDSYADVPEAVADALVARFLELTGRPQSPEAFRRRFDLMALQRNLKALGTFGYQTTSRRNPVYIQYIPRTLRYVRDNLERLPRLANLRELLARDLPELRT